MKRIVMILASERFRDIEYLVPRAFFEQAGIAVTTASTKLESTGRFGYKVQHSHLISDISSADFDGIFLVGGAGSLEYLDNQTAKKIFESFLQAKKPTAAICAAPRNFVKWGFMTDKKVTAHNGDGTFTQFAIEYGAIPQPESTTIKEGNILTANGPEASEECALAFIEMIKGK